MKTNKVDESKRIKEYYDVVVENLKYCECM